MSKIGFECILDHFRRFLIKRQNFGCFFSNKTCLSERPLFNKQKVQTPLFFEHDFYQKNTKQKKFLQWSKIHSESLFDQNFDKNVFKCQLCFLEAPLKTNTYQRKDLSWFYLSQKTSVFKIETAVLLEFMSTLHMLYIY